MHGQICWKSHKHIYIMRCITLQTSAFDAEIHNAAFCLIRAFRELSSQMSGSREGRAYSDRQNLLILENVLTSSPLFAGHLVHGEICLHCVKQDCRERRRSWRGTARSPGPAPPPEGGTRPGWPGGWRESGAAGDVPIPTGHHPAKSHTLPST